MTIREIVAKLESLNARYYDQDSDLEVEEYAAEVAYLTGQLSWKVGLDETKPDE